MRPSIDEESIDRLRATVKRRRDMPEYVVEDLSVNQLLKIALEELETSDGDRQPEVVGRQR